jgi:hypothetical protein
MAKAITLDRADTTVTDMPVTHSAGIHLSLQGRGGVGKSFSEFFPTGHHICS